MKNLLQTAWRSLSDFQWYAQLLKSHAGTSVSYILLGSICLSGLQTLIFRTQTLPQFWQELKAEQTQLVSQYPEELRFSWDQEVLISNRSDVVVPWPSTWPINERLPQQAAIILPTSETDAEKLAQQVLIVVYPTKLALHNTAGEWLEWPLQDLPGFESSFEINRDTITEFSNQVLSSAETEVASWWGWFGPFFWVVLLVELTGLSLLYGLLFWLFVKLGRGRLSWLRCWQLAWHLALIALGITTVANWLAPVSLEYLQPVAVWVLFLSIYYSNRSTFEGRSSGSV